MWSRELLKRANKVCNGSCGGTAMVKVVGFWKPRKKTFKQNRMLQRCGESPSIESLLIVVWPDERAKQDNNIQSEVVNLGIVSLWNSKYVELL